jgi:hypothetical protein
MSAVVGFDFGLVTNLTRSKWLMGLGFVSRMPYVFKSFTCYISIETLKNNVLISILVLS